MPKNEEQISEIKDLNMGKSTYLNPALLGINPTAENKVFLSNVLHNVKNPLGVLLGYSELLLDNELDVSEKERIEFLSEIRETAKLTNKFITRFFEWIYYKTDKIPLEFDEYYLDNILDESCKLLKKEFNNINRISIDIEENLKIFGDKDSLVKIFFYILENSLCYSDVNSKVSVSVKTVDHFCEILIEDNGFGISQITLTKLLKLNENILLNENRDKRRTGLGLIITKLLLEINAGKLKIESSENIGTKVTLKLPVCE